MPKPRPQLLLDEIRHAALPQSLSLELSWTFAGVAEQFARGSDRQTLVRQFCRWSNEVGLTDWNAVALVTIDGELLPLGESNLPQTCPVGEIHEALNEGPAFECVHPITELGLSAETWMPLCAGHHPDHYAPFRIGACGTLILTSHRASQLTPVQKSLAQLIGACLAFLVNPPIAESEETVRTERALDPESTRALRHPFCEPVIVVSRNGAILDASLAATRLLAKSREDLLGSTLPSLDRDADAGRRWEAFLPNTDPTTPPLELHLPTRPSGNASTLRLQPIEATTSRKPSEALDSQPISFRLIEVSSQNALREKADSAEEALKSTLAAPQVFVFHVDKAGIIRSAQGGALQSISPKPPQLEGAKVWDFCQDPKERRRIWRDLRRQGTATHPAKTYFGNFAVTLSASQDALGRLLSATGTAVLQANEHAAEGHASAAAASSNGTWEDWHTLPSWLAPFHLGRDAIVAFDADGTIRYLNHAAEGLFASRLSECKGHPVKELGDFGRLNPLQDCLTPANHPGVLHQVGLERRDGTQLDLKIAVAPIQTPEGDSSGFLMCCRPRPEAEPLPAAASTPSKGEGEASEADNLKVLSTFAGGIAHDFNNILTSLVGNVSLANLLITDNPEATERLIEAERACFRAKDLSHQLLTFAKGGQLAKKVSRLEDLIQQCAEFYLRGSRVAPRIVHPKDLWSVDVDESQIGQVLENLILNAEHSMPRGGIVTIASENYHHTADEKDARLPLSPGFYVKVSIEDQGNGIPESQLPHIFKPYHTSNSNGRSLGLATTFTVIHNHGGHIIAESPKGKGTKFTFYLPATGQTRAPEQKPIDLKKDGEKKGKSGKNGKILVIDDEKSIRDLATTTLKMMGCEVVACESSSKGVERFINDKRQGTPFDLILMDLTIPGDIGGNEAMQQILSIAPNARGIASSGYSEGSVMAHFRQYGFQAALSKPYNIGDLQRMVSNLLSN